MPEPLLEIRDLHISFTGFEGPSHVIAGVDLTLYPGETVALVGETGCGKSVTARAILGLLPGNARVTRGQVLFQGEDVLAMSPRRLGSLRGRGVAMVFQDPMTFLNPVVTVGEQLMAVAFHHLRSEARDAPGPGAAAGVPRVLPQGRAIREAAWSRVVDVLRRVRIPAPEDTARRYPFQLSGGLRQRILIALALLGRPRLLIADEPGTALDVSIKDQILRLLADLVREENLTVLFITHDLGSASVLCRRVCVMYAGQVVEVAATDALFTRQLHPYTAGLLRCVPRLTGDFGEGIEGTIPDYTSPPPGCRFSPRCGARSARCDIERPSLTEVETQRWVACHLYEGRRGVGE
ncbi:MAG: ABC transporter ATP-binding protein [Bacillota bacterium]